MTIGKQTTKLLLMTCELFGTPARVKRIYHMQKKGAGIFRKFLTNGTVFANGMCRQSQSLIHSEERMCLRLDAA